MLNNPEVAAKLRAVVVSPMFTAIVDHLIGDGETRTSPAIAGLTVTSDGYVLAMQAGDCGYNAFIGSASDLVANCRGLARAAELTPDESNAFLSFVLGYMH